MNSEGNPTNGKPWDVILYITTTQDTTRGMLSQLFQLQKRDELFGLCLRKACTEMAEQNIIQQLPIMQEEYLCVNMTPVMLPRSDRARASCCVRV